MKINPVSAPPGNHQTDSRQVIFRAVDSTRHGSVDIKNKKSCTYWNTRKAYKRAKYYET